MDYLPNTLPNTCGNCDEFDSCKNPYKDVNMFCEDAKKRWGEDTYTLPTIYLPTYEAANNVLIKLNYHIIIRGYVTVADYFAMCGYDNPTPEDNRFGWYSMCGVYITPLNLGENNYRINLPHAIRIEINRPNFLVNEIRNQVFNEIVQKLNSCDRYLANSIRHSLNGNIYSKNEVFVVDDIYEIIEGIRKETK